MLSRLRICIIALLLLGAEARSGSVSQTDWSGGGGVQGPVTDWESSFWMETGLDWGGSPSNLLLDDTCRSYSIDEDFQGAFTVSAADMNGDGCSDVIGASRQADCVSWWENGGSGEVWEAHQITTSLNGAYSICVADLTGDGHSDVLAAGYYDDLIGWWENVDGSGTEWSEHILEESFDGARSVDAGDIDGDGDQDALGASENYNSIRWWENDDGSGGSWSMHYVDGYLNARCVSLADIDGDGDSDVLGGAAAYDFLTWWENVDGYGTSWEDHQIDQGGYEINSIAAVDIDADGDKDVLASVENMDGVAWWENEHGSGTSWSFHNVDLDFDDVTCVESNDLNGDGIADILASAGCGEVAAWINSGTGFEWTKRSITDNYSNASSVYPALIDSGDRVDVLASSENLDAIRWWRLPYSGTLTSSILDLQEAPDWDSVGWSSTEPYGTGVWFQLRASDAQGDMGPWSDTLESPCSLEGMLDDGDSLVQYRVMMSRDNLDSIPMLHDVSVSWTPLSGSGGHDLRIAEDEILLRASPNPAGVRPSILFRLPESCHIDLRIYGVDGRLVTSVGDVFQEGSDRLVLEPLPSGVYLVRMRSENYCASGTFVVAR